jgi:heme oxygenase
MEMSVEADHIITHHKSQINIMVIEKIREATKPIHAQLDEWLLPAFQNINNTEKYADILKAFYSYFKPVMDKIDAHIDRTALPDYDDRRKPGTIINDLKAINASTDDISLETALPIIDNSANAIGALYVLEGSTLGGVYLSSVLAKNVPSIEDNALSFFYGYGKESKEKWVAFVDYLNKFAEGANNDGAIVQSAIDTFTFFKEHLQRTVKF